MTTVVRIAPPWRPRSWPLSVSTRISVCVHAGAPIFGATSEHAAYAALAVKKDGGDYLGPTRLFMEARPFDDASIDSLAVSKGAHQADITPGSASTAQLAATSALFDKLALDGTPGFVVGNKILTGEDMVALEAAIDRLMRAAHTSA